MGLFDFFKKNKDNKAEKSFGNKKLENTLPEYIVLPYFGQLDVNSLEDYYESSTTINGQAISIDLNFDNSSADKLKMATLKNVLENIENFDNQNKIYINNDYNDVDGDTVKSYLENHLEQFDDEELNLLIDKTDTSINPERQLLKKLTLVRLGLYPDNEEYLTTFDYSIGKDITQYLVVVTTDKDGKLNYITMES